MSTNVTMSELINRPSPEFEDLFRKYRQLVYGTARVITGSPADAEDILQTIFLRILRRTVPPSFSKDPANYFYRAAVNLSLNTLRSRKRRVLIGDPNFFDVSQLTGQPNIDEAIIRQLRAAIATLSPR